jgi:hypothetical protein
MKQHLYLNVRKGSTFSRSLFYASPVLSVRPITGLTNSGQAVVTAVAHGLVTDWWVFVVGVQGMDQVNNRSEDLSIIDRAYRAYYVDADKVRLNLDTSRFGAYVSGGELLFFPPVDISLWTARMELKVPDAEGTILQSLTTENGGITLTGAGEIKLLISSVDTTLYVPETEGVWDLELVDPTGVVIPVIGGNFKVSDEVTT